MNFWIYVCLISLQRIIKQLWQMAADALADSRPDTQLPSGTEELEGELRVFDREMMMINTSSARGLLQGKSRSPLPFQRPLNLVASRLILRLSRCKINSAHLILPMALQQMGLR